MAEQGKQAIADEIGGCLLAADHGDDHVGDHLLLRKPVAVHFRRCESVHQALCRLAGFASDSVAEISCHLLQAAEHSRSPIRVVLKVTEHLGEVLRPVLKSVVVPRRDTEQARR